METKTKNHVCPVDRRRFATKQALDQHRCDAHGGVVAAKPGRAGRRNRTRRPARLGRAAGGGLGIDVAPSSTRPAPGGSITVSGEDRIGIFLAGVKGAVYQSYQLNTGSSLRLATIGRAFQRIRWDSVEIRVVPQAPLTVMGGYVCGFIMDPEDRSVTSAMLTSTQNAITRKWYETAVVRMPPKTDLLYTSPGTESRTFSPGTFWVISEGNPNVSITTIVTMSWRVTLSNPTVENEQDLSFVIDGDILPIPANYNVQLKTCDGKLITDFSSRVPASVAQRSGDYHFFRVPTFIIEYSEGTGDTGSVQQHFLVYRPSDKKMYYSSSGSSIDQTVWQSNVTTQVLVPSGTLLRYDGTGNGCKAVSEVAHRSLQSRDLPSLQEQLLSMGRNLTQLLDSFGRLEMASNLGLSPSSSRSSLVHLGSEL